MSLSMENSLRFCSSKFPLLEIPLQTFIAFIKAVSTPTRLSKPPRNLWLCWSCDYQFTLMICCSCPESQLHILIPECPITVVIAGWPMTTVYHSTYSMYTLVCFTCINKLCSGKILKDKVKTKYPYYTREN